MNRVTTQRLIEITESRTWLVSVPLLVIGLVAWSSTWHTQAIAARSALAAAHQQRDRLMAQAATLQAQAPLRPAYQAWNELRLLADRHATRVVAATETEFEPFWSGGTAPAWKGALLGKTGDVTATLLAIEPMWDRYRPLAMHVKGDEATALIGVFGSAPEGTK
ncbi:MAG: hypothetical protein H6981_01255 [Gammaproteobacteria bacterium]|nr:hypothetical protein [Gammaproteobacteria bacterium]MCP5135413.1 hypothetical protein [Gammaproteobacteria bacterium]